MENFAFSREYGSRYQETRIIKDLALLAERMIVELSRATNVDGAPASAEFSIHVIANVLLNVYVGGLPDDFTFADRPSRRHSAEAKALLRELDEVVGSYDWSNPADPTDRRFVYGVHLLAEADFRSVFWTPGVIRLP